MAASSGAIKAGRAYVEIFADSSPLVRGLKAAEAKVKGFGKSLVNIGAGITAVGTSAVGALIGTAVDFAMVGGALDDMSQRTGATSEALSELGFAAQMAGTSSETLETGLTKMQQTIADAANGSDTAAKALKAVGLSAAQLINLSPDQQMQAIAEGLKGISNPALQASASIDIFKGAGSDLLPMLKGGAAGLQEMRNEAQRLGRVMSTEDAQSAASLGDSFDLLTGSMNQILINVGAALAPMLTDLASTMTEVAAGVSKFVSENRDLIITAAKVAVGIMAAGAAITVIGAAIVGVGAVIGGIGAIVTGIGVAIGAATAAVSAIASAFAFLISPLGLVIVAATAVAGAFIYFSGVGSKAMKMVSDAANTMRQFFGDALQGVTDSLMSGDIEGAATVLWAALKLLWTSGTAGLTEQWNKWGGFIVDIFADITTALAIVWTNLTFDLATLWGKFVSTDFGGAFLDQIQSMLGGFLEFIGAIEDIAGIELVDQEGIKKGFDEFRKQSANMGYIEKQRAEALKAVEDAAAESLAARLKQRAESLNTANDANTAAAAEFNKAVADAAAKREAAEEKKKKKKKPIGEASAVTPNFTATMESKLSTTGTFSGQNIAGLGGGSVDKQQLEELKQVNRQLKKLQGPAVIQ